MQIDFGVPIAIESAEVHVDELSTGATRCKAAPPCASCRGRVWTDGSGERFPAGSSTADPRLTIRGSRGELEDGRVVTLGDARGDRPAFAIDLVAPFQFRLASRCRRSRSAGCCADCSNRSSRATAACPASSRSPATCGGLTGIEGQGKLSLRDTTLWSIPVVRDLLSQFDLDSSAVFESIETDLRIQHGAIKMDA
jgi:hypothetical protein